MAKDRVTVAKRAIWRRVVGTEIANRNTRHAERHFLPHAAEARGEPPEDNVELGRWSGSTAQDADLEPTLRAQPALPPAACRLAARSVRASRQGQSRHRHHHASDECHPPAHLVAVGRPPLGGRLAALGGTEAAALSCPGLI